MPRSSPNAELESEELDCTVRIRAAIEEEHEALLRSIALHVAKTGRELRWPAVMDIASEVFHEAVQEALKHADHFDPTRSAAAWVRGIAARLLLTRRRAEARAWRCIPAAVLGEEAWAAALGQLCTEPTDLAVDGRLDLERALARISPDARRAIEFRYYQALDGEELAAALGVSTPGAARVRVCRALQALRTHLSAVEEEVLP
ncbi:MAG TPA: sigma-70 family RNA polymerase sigma factor [Isosphaeraceae bacterium]|nr:sigma-70 family RNA polymerase sigma factor [Isosphaeraceae bacterium]